MVDDSLLIQLEDLQLPFDNAVVEQVQTIATERSHLIDELALRILQDPVVLLELFNFCSDILFLEEDVSPTTVKIVLSQMGAHHLSDFSNALKPRETKLDSAVVNSIARFRNKSRRAAVIAQILAHVTNPELTDEAQTATALSFLGEMAACAIYKEDFLRCENNSSSLNQLRNNLTTALNVDVAAVRLQYCQIMSVPAELGLLLSSDEDAEEVERLETRRIQLAAVELVDSYDRRIWSRYQQASIPPDDSALVALSMTPEQYERIIQRCDEFLEGTARISDSADEDVDPYADSAVNYSTETEDRPRAVGPVDYKEFLDDEVQTELFKIKDRLNEPVPLNEVERSKILDSRHKGSDEEQKLYPMTVTGSRRRSQNVQKLFSAPRDELQFPELPKSGPKTNLDALESKLGTVAEQKESVAKIVGSLIGLSGNVTSGVELVEKALKMMIDEGPFSRVAILELGQNRRFCTVLRSVGGLPRPATRVPVFDPLSPINLEQLTIKSFNAKKGRVSTNPFGVSSYAVCPLEGPADRVLCLYADCGQNESVPFDSRTIFRFFAGNLNELLKEFDDLGELS